MVTHHLMQVTLCVGAAWCVAMVAYWVLGRWEDRER